MKIQLTYKKLTEVLEYDPETGKLYWKISKQKVKEGSEAGYLNKNGYISVMIDGKHHQVHKLAYMLYHKTILINEVDHIDGNRSNNIIANLRECDRSENIMNTKTRSDNTSGVKGVCLDRRCNKLVVRLHVNGKSKNLGYFPIDQIGQAEACVKSARQKYHGLFANHG